MQRAEKYAVGFECGIQVGTEFWFLDMRENVLYCCNKDKISYMGEFLQEDGERLFSDIKYYEDKLIFVPLLANKIAIYNLLDKKFEYILLPFERNTRRGLFSTSIIWKRYIYLFPLYYDKIIKMDLQSGTMELIKKFGLEDDSLEEVLCMPYFRTEYCHVDDKVYIPFMSNGALLEFDLSNDTGRVINLEGRTGFTSIVRNGEDFWLCSRKISKEEKAIVVCWNRMRNTISSYPIDLPTDSICEPIGSICNEEYCWFFLSYPNKVLKVKLDTGEISKERLFADINNCPITPFSIWRTSFTFCQKQEDGVLLCDGKSSKVIWFEPNTGVVKSWTLKMPEERRPFYKKTISKLYNYFLQEERKKDIHHESAFFGPVDMLEDLVE